MYTNNLGHHYFLVYFVLCIGLLVICGDDTARCVCGWPLDQSRPQFYRVRFINQCMLVSSVLKCLYIIFRLHVRYISQGRIIFCYLYVIIKLFSYIVSKKIVDHDKTTYQVIVFLNLYELF